MIGSAHFAYSEGMIVARAGIRKILDGIAAMSPNCVSAACFGMRRACDVYDHIPHATTRNPHISDKARPAYNMYVPDHTPNGTMGHAYAWWQS